MVTTHHYYGLAYDQTMTEVKIQSYSMRMLYANAERGNRFLTCCPGGEGGFETATASSNL